MVSRKSAHQHKLEMQGLREKEAHNADEIMKMKKDESLGSTNIFTNALHAHPWKANGRCHMS